MPQPVTTIATIIGFGLLAGLGLTRAGEMATAEAERTEERFIPNYAAGEIYYLWVAPADLDATPGAGLQVHETAIKAPVPIWLAADTRITAGLHWRWNRLDFSGSPTFPAALNLHRVQVPLDFWHSFNDRWKAWGRVEPGLFTDFDNVNHQALAVTVLALGSYQFTPEFSAAFGLYYSRDLGDDRLLPALGAIWKPNRHWNIGLTYPRASVSYAPDPTWLLNLSIAPGGAGWSLADPTTGADRRLNYENWRVTWAVEHEFVHVFPARLWVFGGIGLQFGQELELKDGNDVTLFTTELEAAPFVTAGVRLRF